MAKRITFLLGNGAAIPWGAPKTYKVTDHLRNLSGYQAKNNLNIFEYLYQKMLYHGAKESEINFETLISCLESIDEYAISRVRNHNKDLFNQLPFLFEPKRFINELKNYSTEHTNYLMSNTWDMPVPVDNEMYSDANKLEAIYWDYAIHWAIKEVINYIARYSKNVTEKVELNRSLNSLIQYFWDQGYVVRFYTTNYDRLLPDITDQKVFDGFSEENLSHDYVNTKHAPDLKGIFSNKKNCLNYFNLHGSFFWDMEPNEGNNPYIFFRTNHVSDKTLGFNEHNSNPNQPIKLFNIITGYNKMQRLAVNPFNAFQAVFQEDCINSELIVTAGYSFGDPHINTAIKNGVNDDSTSYLHITSHKPSDSYVDHFFDSTQEGIFLNNKLHKQRNIFDTWQDNQNGWYVSNYGILNVFIKGYDEFLLSERFKELNLPK